MPPRILEKTRSGCNPNGNCRENTIRMQKLDGIIEKMQSEYPQDGNHSETTLRMRTRRKSSTKRKQDSNPTKTFEIINKTAEHNQDANPKKTLEKIQSWY